MTAPVADVIVVGLGAMGGGALWRLALRGVEVVGVEQFAPGHDRGSSHGQSRIIRTAYSEGGGYVELAQRAWRLWEELEGEAGETLLEPSGVLLMGDADSPWVGGALASAAAHNLPHELLRAAEIRERFPQHAGVEDPTVGFYERQAGVLRPERAVRAAVAVATAAGAGVVEGQAVREILPDPERPAVRLDDRTLVARRLVVSVGAWLPRLLPDLELPLRVVRRVQTWFEPPSTDEFAPDRFPAFIRSEQREGEVERSWYGCPTMDGVTVKAALHEWPGLDEPVDPDVGPRPPDDVDAKRVAALVEEGLPGLGPGPSRMQACMYTLTPDLDFIVGRREDLPGVVLLGGFSGHGFKFSPVMGEVAAQLALTAETDVPIDLFDPHRFDGRARSPRETR
jgi:sarcosine oxidase